MTKSVWISIFGGAVGASLCAFVFSCAPFLDSPYSDQLLHPSRSLNTVSMQRLGDIEADGKIRIAVFSDAHQNYRDLDKVIYAINAEPNLDFAAYLGDFTNSGYNLEYDQFLDSVDYLRYPMLTSVGNHDSIGAGPSLFKKAFGPSNFYFESASRRFVFFNSANLENPKEFDPTWLKTVVDGSTKPVFIFSHMSLRDPERFLDETATVFDSIIKDSKVQLILNGHNHVYSLNTDNNTIMLQASRIENLQWMVIEIQGNQLTINKMDTKETILLTLK